MQPGAINVHGVGPGRGKKMCVLTADKPVAPAARAAFARRMALVTDEDWCRKRSLLANVHCCFYLLNGATGRVQNVEIGVEAATGAGAFFRRRGASWPLKLDRR